MKKNQQIEILIVVILALILGCYVAVTYLIKPIGADTDSINLELDKKESALRLRYMSVGNYSDNREKLDFLKEALEADSGNFYPENKEEVYLEHVSVNVSDCQVTFSSLSALDGNFRFSTLYGGADVKSGVYNGLTENEKLKELPLLQYDRFVPYFNEITANGGRMENEIRTTSMTVEASGSYGSVLRFLEGLTSKGKNVVCNSLTLEIAENVSIHAPSDPQARLTVDLTFVTVPGLEALCALPDPEPFPDYTFPKDILDGSYRR